MKRLVLAAAVLALSAAAASADPVLDQVTTTTARSGVVTVAVETTLSAKGEVWVTGDVNGQPITMRKRLRASHKTLKFVVDPRRFRLRKLTAGLHFTLNVAAVETDSNARTSRDVTADVPVPCVVLPGLGDEQTPGGFAAFASAIDLAAGGRYQTGGKKPFLVVHEYASLTKSLAALGLELDKTVKLALRGTPFVKADIVGYSYGGVVARSYLAQKSGARVRSLSMLGSPNKGTPIAYIGVGLLNNGMLAGLLTQNADLGAAVGNLVTPQTKGALRNLYPTYDWLDGDALTEAVVRTTLGDSTTPLTVLNQKAPPFGVRFEAFYYSSTPGGQLGTVDHVNVAGLASVFLGGNIDPTALATGAGDGVVPSHSVLMTDNAAGWQIAITGHDLGAGTHVTMPLDPNVIAGVSAVLAQ